MDIEEIKMSETPRWTWHMLAGVLIFFLLGLHMLTMHLDDIVGWFNPVEGKSSVHWDNVAARAGLISYTVIYIALLGAALYHGLYGLRTILFELGPGRGVRRTVNFLLLAVGLGLFAIGTWAAIAAYIRIPGAST
jgi:succinate dehydrogenase / fumarate reductase membrane anchor subunit